MASSWLLYRRKQMKGSEISSSTTPTAMIKTSNTSVIKPQKPQFRPAQDDTKPPLKDPILRSDPIETEEAVLKLPPFPVSKSQ